MIVYCATSNAGKLREFRLAGERVGIAVEPLPGLRDIAAPEETGDTFEANAIEKALYYGARTDGWLFVDDSGLEVDALGGAPGVYSARYAGDDDANNAKVLENLGDNPDRGAQFVCVIALVHAHELVLTFRGIVRGEIVDAPRGPNGFGYDPLFYYADFGCTFGEAPLDRKMGVSHRARALEAMFRFLRSQSE